MGTYRKGDEGGRIDWSLGERKSKGRCSVAGFVVQTCPRLQRPFTYAAIMTLGRTARVSLSLGIWSKDNDVISDNVSTFPLFRLDLSFLYLPRNILMPIARFAFRALR
jgi:hypothetical protein